MYSVSGTSRCLFSDKYKTHKYSLGRTYSCWILNCWCITWPLGFKSLRNSRRPHRFSCNNIFQSVCCLTVEHITSKCCSQNSSHTAWTLENSTICPSFICVCLLRFSKQASIISKNSIEVAVCNFQTGIFSAMESKSSEIFYITLRLCNVMWGLAVHLLEQRTKLIAGILKRQKEEKVLLYKLLDRELAYNFIIKTANKIKMLRNRTPSEGAISGN